MNLPLPYSFCKLNKVTLTQSDNISTLHVCGSLNAQVLSNIEHLFLSEIVKVNHTEDEFESLLTDLYTNKSEDFSLDQVEELDLLDIANSISPSDDLLDDKNKGPIIKLINATITKAINARASDIHLEPFENKLRMMNIYIENSAFLVNIARDITNQEDWGPSGECFEPY